MSLTVLKEGVKSMKTKVLILCSALPLTALMTSGCYTVLSSPYETASLHDEDLVRAKSRDVEAPTVGQFDDRDYMDTSTVSGVVRALGLWRLLAVRATVAAYLSTSGYYPPLRRLPLL